MTAIDLDPTDVLAVLDFRRDHSPLWHWMKANHDALVERAAGDRLPWIAMCEVFAQRGLANRTGGMPTPACAKLTWHRVKAYLKKQQDRLAAVREKIAEDLARKRTERDIKREVALASSRAVAPQPMSWPPPPPKWGNSPQKPVAVRTSAMPPIVQPATPDLSHLRPQVDACGAPLEKKIVVEGEPLAHPEDLPGLPSRAGYVSINQWHRDAYKIILAKPEPDRTTKERKIMLQAQMIGNQH